jgi:hypothetical protein
MREIGADVRSKLKGDVRWHEQIHVVAANRDYLEGMVVDC